MIEQNLGVLERIVRLMLGVALGAWTMTQPSFGLFESFALIIASFLILNAISARCYLWHALGLNSCDDETEGCRKEPC